MTEAKQASTADIAGMWGVAIIGIIVGFIFLQPTTAHAGTTWLYTFNSPGTLFEAGSMSESWSRYYWLNSGGKMLFDGAVGMTAQGPLASIDFWRGLYGRSNPLDTGDGYYPQNLFRLVTRATYGDIAQSVSFNIKKINTTNTPNRDGYSGILLMSRYVADGQTLYYAGLRQDGSATIKKKYQGRYTTLALTPVFSGSYNKSSNPNLIPMNQWMDLKSVVTNENGGVRIDLYLDRRDGRGLVKIATALDNATGGTPAITGSAHAGIRTDYMDVTFDNHRIESL